MTAIYVKVSTDVAKGDPLFEIDPRELQAKLLIQKANLKVSKANLIRLQEQLQRLHSVKDPRAVSQEDIKTRENDVHIAEAEVFASRSQIKETKLLIERLTVRAPKDGMILQNNIRVGEYFTASSDQPALVLGSDKKLQIRVDIDEQNASRFQSEFPAIAYLKNNTHHHFPVTFDHIEPYMIPKKSLTGAPEERVDTRVLQVIYSFKKPTKFHVFVGQQVDVFIEEKSDE